MSVVHATTRYVSLVLQHIIKKISKVNSFCFVFSIYAFVYHDLFLCKVSMFIQ